MGILLKNIHKTYKGRSVIADLNLSVKKGEFHVLLGASGSGKTTILSIIAGLVRPDKGEVIIGREPVTGLPPERRTIGFVFQNYALFPHLSIFDNVAFGLRIKKVPKAVIDRKVHHYLERIGIDKERDKFPAQLSGGQQQRVALIRTLITEPRILLMDEPLSSLDPIAKDGIIHDIKKFNQELGMTTVYVTHNQEEALSLGHRVSVLNHGQIEQIETAEEIFLHPKTEYVARFLGTRNILNAQVLELRANEAVLRIMNKGLARSFDITVRRYPIFEKGKHIDVCIHPDRLQIRKDEYPDSAMVVNRIRGIVTEKRDGCFSKRVAVDLGGLVLHASIGDNAVSCAAGDEVSVCFPFAAPHPLCGKSSRSPEPYRKCMKMNFPAGDRREVCNEAV